MLNEHTLNQLRGLRLDGMVRAIEDQASSAAAAALGFEDRLTCWCNARWPGATTGA
jgi:hypothetical protein